MSKYSTAEKQAILARYQSGESVTALSAETNISQTTIYLWIRQDKEYSGDNSYFKREITKYENKIKRLEGIIEIIKKSGCALSDPLEVKLPALEALQDQYNVHMLCEALDVSRATYYNYIYRSKRDNTWYAKRREEIRFEIQKIFDDSHQIFGAQKIHAVLQERGIRTSVSLVTELMKDMGITSIRNSSKSEYDKDTRRAKNILNQQFDTSRPDECWVSDVTYFRLNESNYYICVIIDLYSRRVIAYKIAKKNSTQLVHSTMKIAYENRKPTLPLMLHTDRGSNYRSYAFCNYLKTIGVTHSFSRTHMPYDNSVMESFFSKQETGRIISNEVSF